jgi:hypothetical protein
MPSVAREGASKASLREHGTWIPFPSRKATVGRSARYLYPLQSRNDSNLPHFPAMGSDSATGILIPMVRYPFPLIAREEISHKYLHFSPTWHAFPYAHGGICAKCMFCKKLCNRLNPYTTKSKRLYTMYTGLVSTPLGGGLV